jgi:signal transduction histidine kinase
MSMRELRILVVDDSEPLREFIVQALLRREGFNVTEAADGAQGLEMALSEAPDLILMDLEMPRLTGLEVVDALRDQEADIPIILMTSYGSEAVVVEVFRKGVKDYLIKPFSAEEMYFAVDRALNEVRLRREKEMLTHHLTTTNEELRRRVEELGILYQVGKSVTAQLSQKEVLERILEALFFVIDAEEATLMLVDEETGRLRTELYYQRVPGEVRQVSRRSAGELAADSVDKGDATSSGAMLYAPLKVGERVIGSMGVGNSISTRPFSSHDRRLLLALADYAAIAIDNARLYGEVNQANKAKSEFVSLVAHELRTPMTSIRGYADMLSKGVVGPLDPQQLQFIDTIHSNVERMQVLVSDLQDISKIETGYLRLEGKTISLATVLESALQSTGAQMEARFQKLTVDIPRDLPLVYADPSRLAQILINLLSNAYKYTPEGGSISVRAWTEDGHVYCAVSDTGIGISEEDQAQLFTKFFRSGDPVVRNEMGTGLGLCVVRSLVELQGGEIAFESSPGKGTTFTFTVPLAADRS